jgi:hypothetical protein
MVDIAAYTLIDITYTNTHSNALEHLFQRNQQRNWETAHQCLNLVSAIKIKAVPGAPKIVDLAYHRFSSQYSGMQRCWKFIFSLPSHDLDSIKDSFNYVPIIKNLDETVTLSNPYFSTSGSDINIYFKPIPGNG